MRLVLAFVAIFVGALVFAITPPNMTPVFKHQNHHQRTRWPGQAAISGIPGMVSSFTGMQANAATYIRPPAPNIPRIGTQTAPQKTPTIPKPRIPTTTKKITPPSRSTTDPPLYDQAVEPIIYESVLWTVGNTVEYQGPLVPTGSGNCGGQFFPTTGTNNYPFPDFVGGPNGNGSPGSDDLVSPMTFYDGDGTGSNTIGIIGTPGTVQNSNEYYVNALQGGSTIGVSLAPRAVDPYGTSGNGGLTNIVVLNDYLPCSNFPTPWATGTTIQYSVDMVIPFAYNNPVAGGLIENNGMSFIYFVLELRNINNGSSIVIAPRIMQSQALVGSDVTGPNAPVFAFAQSNEANTVTLTPDYALIYPPIGNSSIVSNCGTAPMNTAGGNPYMHTYCFQMTGSGLTQAINYLNSGLGKSYDTNPANWEVVAINLDMEAWAWSYPIDARLGLSYSNFNVSAF